jgi:cytochrome b
VSYARASDRSDLREPPAPGGLPQPEADPGKVLIWDVPIRVFHVLFAVCCVAAMGLALVGDDFPHLFALHMVFGIAAAFLLIVRLVIAVVAGRHNRLRTMVFSPRETVAYVTGIVAGSAPRYPVHNPATSLVALVMFAVVPILLWTGLTPERQAADELHALFAYCLLVLIAAHLAGLAVHTLRHRENVSTAMLTGRKRSASACALPSARRGWGTALLVCSLVWIGLLFASYDATVDSVTLPLIGTTIDLGVSEGATLGERGD